MRPAELHLQSAGGRKLGTKPDPSYWGRTVRIGGRKWTPLKSMALIDDGSPAAVCRFIETCRPAIRAKARSLSKPLPVVASRSLIMKFEGTSQLWLPSNKRFVPSTERLIFIYVTRGLS
jgi:hypothetical protein